MATRLVGRETELALLKVAVSDLAAGRGGLVVVAGEAGVGKSRLVSEAATAAAAAGVTVFTGRAVEDTATPLRAVAEAFFAAFRDRPPPTDPALAPFRAALGSLVPEWQPLESAPVEPLVRNEGVLRLLRTLGGPRGCLLLVEDLHWAEPETMAVVEHLAAHASSQRVLCFATVRSEPPSPGLDVVRSLSAAGAARMLELVRLSDAEVGELARAVAGDRLDPIAVRSVCERAEGLPLLAEDLVATARTTGAAVSEVVPLTFAGTVQRRLAALGADGVKVVRAAAVLGRRFDWRLLPAVAGVDEAAVAAVLRAAADAQLVAAPAGGGFAFRHALTRDAVLSHLLPTERSQFARRALEVVDDGHPGLPGEWCELAANLAEAAGDTHRFGTLMLESVRRAIGGGNLLAAEATLERARAVLGADQSSVVAGADGGSHNGADELRSELDQLLLEVLSLAGKTDLALELGQSLLARQAGTDAAATHLRLARAAAAGHRWPLARHHIAETRRLAPAASNLAVRADALGATVAITEGRTEQAVDLAQRAVAVGRRVGVTDAVCEALEVLGRAARRDDLDRAEESFASAAETARQAGLRLWEISALHELGTVDMLRTSNLERLELAHRLATEAGALAIAAVVDLQLAGSYALRFEPEAALRVVERGVEVAELFDLGLTLPMLVVQGASAHAIAGRRAEMEAAIDRAAALSGDHADVWTVAWGHCRGLLALLEEDRLAAHGAFREALAWSRHPECGVPGAFSGWLALVATLDDADGRGGATTRAELGDTSSMVISVNRALLGYAEAIALGRAGRGLEAAAIVSEMDALLRTKQGFEGWGYLGRRLVGEAAIVDGWGEPIDWLREALPWFESRGHARVVAACRQLLSRAGAPVPRRGRGDSDVPPELRARGVTSREVDVLALVAKGLSNVEIAERLYLSPRTVEKHVEHLRDKTATESRAELARVGGNYGLAGC